MATSVQEAIAQRLLRLREERLADAREKAEQASTLADTGVADPGDQSVIDEQADILGTLNDREREEVREIDDALHRLRTGTYGTCEDCGGEIGGRRLDVQPFARYCVGCQDERERAESTSPTRGKI